MELLYFSTENNADYRRKLFEEMQHALPGITIEVFNDIKSLKQRLQTPPRRFLACIYEICDRKTISDLVEIRDLFADRRTVFAIPDYSYQSLIYANNLSPQYLFSVKDEHHGVVAVLSKWLAMVQFEDDWAGEA